MALVKGRLMASIVLDNCSFSYSNNPSDRVISGLSLKIEAGSFVSVIGPNGSGKSTFARLLNGLLIPQEGEVLVDGLSTKNSKDIYKIRRKVSLLFQNPDNQIVGDSVEEDTAFGPENLGLERDEITKRVESSLKAVGLWEKRKNKPSSLSGGEKARLGIAGVLAISPEVLVLDEATAMLDEKGRKEVMEILLSLKKNQGKTIILVTHHPEETLFGDRIIVIDKGNVILDGEKEEVYNESLMLSSLGVPIPPLAELYLAMKKKGLKDDKVFLSVSSLYKALERNKV